MIRVAAARDTYARLNALTLLYSRLPQGEREEQLAATLAAVQRGELLLDDLLVAERGGILLGVVLAVRQAGRSAFLWPPVVTAKPDADAVIDHLLEGAGRRMDEHAVLFTQCLVEPDDAAYRDALDRNGFVHQADLLFLKRSLDDPLPEQAELPWEAIPYHERHHARFARLIERTYIGTRDCPGLHDVRSGDEALAAHQAAGAFDPSRWTLYHARGDQGAVSEEPAEVGVLLLADWPESSTWEVTYMGVAPEARGRGYGRAILLDGLHRARSAGRQAMVLTVDGGNLPALGIYRELGFAEQAVRAVHLRFHPGVNERGN